MTTTPVQREIIKRDEYLSRQIKDARSRIQVLDVFTGATIVCCGAVAYVLCATMIDQVLVLSTAMRFAMLIGFALATLGVLAYWVFLPATRRINPLYAAHAVEKSRPQTKNSLTNWLQLKERGDNIPDPIMKAIELRAVDDVRRIDLHEAIDSKPLVHSFYTLGAVVVIFCAYSFFTTKSLAPSIRRVLFPLAEIAPPTATNLMVHQDPTGAELPAGVRVNIYAYASGRQPEKVTAYIANNEENYWEPHPLDPPKEKYGRWDLTLHDLQKSFRYYVVANDYTSPTHHVTISPAPMVTDWKVTYHFPSYTREPARTEVGGDIEAIEGTQVEVEVTTSTPAASGRLDLKIGQRDKRINMLSHDGSSNKLAGRFVLEDDGSYTVDFEDFSRPPRRPQIRPMKSIKVERDLTPKLKFVEPDTLSVKRPANGIVRFRLAAADDFGLKRVSLFFQDKDGKILREKETSIDRGAASPSLMILESLDLAPLQLKPGDVIEYWAEALDNKLPTAGVANTREEKRMIVIEEPLTPKEREQQVQEQKEQQQKDQQEQQQNQPDQRNQQNDRADQPNDDQPGADDQPADGKEGKQGTGKSQKNGKGNQGEPDQQNDAGEGEPSNEPQDPQDQDDKSKIDKLRDFFDRKNQKQPDQPKNGDQKQNPADMKNDPASTLR